MQMAWMQWIYGTKPWRWCVCVCVHMCVCPKTFARCLKHQLFWTPDLAANTLSTTYHYPPVYCKHISFIPSKQWLKNNPYFWESCLFAHLSMLFPKLQASPDFVPVAVEVVAQVSPNAPEPACDAVICMWCPTCRWLLFTTTTASSWIIQLTQSLLNGPSFSFCKTTSRKSFLVVTHWYLTSFGNSNPCPACPD